MSQKEQPNNYAIIKYLYCRYILLSKKFFGIIDRLDINYDSYMLEYMKQHKINMVKDIIYVLLKKYIIYDFNRNCDKIQMINFKLKKL